MRMSKQHVETAMREAQKRIATLTQKTQRLKEEALAVAEVLCFISHYFFHNKEHSSLVT